MTKRKFRMDFWTITSIILMAVFLIFLVYPIGGLLKEAFFKDGAFSLDAFALFFSKKHYFGTIGNSTRIGLAVTAISLLAGIPFSYFYSFYELKGKKVIFVLCLLCTMSAPFIGAYAWILLLGNSGILTGLLKAIGIRGVSIYGFGGIVFVQVLKLFRYPLPFLIFFPVILQ